MKKLNKKKIICLILIFCFCVNIFGIKIVKADDTEIINFNDENFKKALIEIGVDKNGDGEISKEEANKVTRISITENKNITDISEVKYFSNLEKFTVTNNEYEDISALKSLGKLKTVNITGNRVNCSPLRSFDEDTMKTIDKLKENEITFIGIDEQTLDYDESKIENQPKHKVLFVYVKDIDVVTEKDGEMVNYKNTLTDDDIVYFDLCQEMFEKTTEKLSDYTIDIVRETYITKDVVTEATGDIRGKYMLYPWNIPEIEKKLNLYDTIFICTMYDDNLIYTGANGTTPYPTYDDNGDYYGFINIFYKPNWKEQSELIRQGKYTIVIPAMVHEFCHSLEGFGDWLQMPIWPYHTAINYYTELGHEFSDFYASAEYLRGVSNPKGDGKTGIVNHLWELSPSKTAGKLIAINETEINLDIGDTKALYCNVKNKNYPINGAFSGAWTTNVEWSSTDSEIASVDEKGIVCAKKSGTCYIIAENKELEQSIRCKVNIAGNDNLQKEIESISIKDNPNRINYFKGDTLDLYGLTINVNYSDGTSEEKESGYTCDKTELNKAGKQTVTISYEGKNAILNVNVYNMEEIAKDWTDMSNLKYQIVNTGTEENPEYSLNINNFKGKKNHNYYVWLAQNGDEFIEENKVINGLTANQVNSISFIKFENLSANIDYWMDKSNDLSFQIIEEYEVANGLTAFKVVYGKNKLEQSNKNNIKVEYKILEGAKQELDENSDLIVKADGDINKFVGLNIDGKEINKDNYTVKSGSTIVTLKKEFLSTLNEGEHVLTFVYEDGKVSTTFKLAKKEEPSKEKNDETDTNPQTGDAIMIFVGLMCVSIITLIVIRKIKS